MGKNFFQKYQTITEKWNFFPAPYYNQEYDLLHLKENEILTYLCPTYFGLLNKFYSKVFLFTIIKDSHYLPRDLAYPGLFIYLGPESLLI